MAHKKISHEAQIALERAKAAGMRVEALTAQLALARLENKKLQEAWITLGNDAGMEEGDVITDDYRIQRRGVFVEETAEEAVVEAPS